MEESSFSVVAAGGDLRQVYAANALARAGFAVTAIGFREGLPFEGVKCENDWSVLETADLVLFPLTMTKGEQLNTPLYDGEMRFEDCLKKISTDCQVFGGNVTAAERELAEKYEINLRDFFRVEELTIANAVLTAEAAIQLAMERLPSSLWRSKILICGYGRIGRVLLQRLKAFGAELTVVARKAEQRIWAEIDGAKAISFEELSEILPNQQIIFNTVPQRVLGSRELEKVSGECLLMELASKPYGIDLEAAEAMELNAVLASGLPGKHCPQMAGELIANCIVNMRKG